MDLSGSDLVEDELSMASRLEKIKGFIQKASKETVLEENDDPNASFHLGMELFGHETSYIERSLQKKLMELEKDVTDIVEKIQNGETEEVQPPASFQSSADLEGEAERLQEHVSFLQACSKARENLDESIAFVSPAISNQEENIVSSTKQFLLACEQVTCLSKMRLTDHQMLIFRDLRSAVRRQKLDLLGRIQKVWFESVEVTPTMLSVRSQHLGPVYDAIELFKQDEGVTASTLDMIFRKLIKSLMEILSDLLGRHGNGTVRSSWKAHESHDRVASGSVLTKKGSTIRLEWTRDDDGILNGESVEKSSVQDWKGTFDFIQRLLLFVSKHVLLERKSLCQLLGKKLMGKPDSLPSALNLDALGFESQQIGDDNGMIMQPLMELLAKTTIPKFLDPEEMSSKLDSTSEELDAFIDPFLQELVGCNMLGEESTRLDKFVASFEQKYVDNRRCLLLNEARTLLRQSDYQNTVEVGQDPPEYEEGGDDGLSVFLFHKASVSHTASNLLSLCRQAMDEAVSQKSQPSDSPLGLLPATLYRAAREMLDLFRAIIPVMQGGEIRDIPRSAAIHHNDCVYLAHNCLTLGLEYRKRFPATDDDDVQGKLLRQSCMFVDMVPMFRNMADRALKDMLQKQAIQVKELVEPRLYYWGKSLESDEIVAEWSEAQSALEAAIYHLRHLFKVWQPVLSKDVLTRCMGYLMDIALTLYLEEMDKAAHISLNATHFISSLVQQGCCVVDDNIVLPSCSRTVGRWTATGKFMGMNLSEITASLSEGTFLSMTGAELAHLTKAVYQDSPQRRDLLNILSRT